MRRPVICLLLSILAFHLMASKRINADQKDAETQLEEADSLRANVEGRALGVLSPAYGASFGGYGGQGSLHPYQSQQLQFLPQHRQFIRQITPIRIPFIDKNGCRFPGDVVCSPNEDDESSYGLCVLRNEGKNLWKKPSMQVVERQCDSDTRVSYDWCNNNERIMRTTGFIQHAEELPIYNHKKKYFVKLSPCLIFSINEKPCSPIDPYCYYQQHDDSSDEDDD